jgi:hypothetical protein
VTAVAKETPAGAPEAKDEVDLVRAAIWFLGILIVGLGGVYAVLLRQRDGYREAVQYGEKNLKAMAVQYDQVAALLKQYEESGADEAEKATRTWLQQRYRAAGIQDGQVATENWKDKPQRDHLERAVDVVVKNVRRDQAVHFLWNVEKVSPKMRTLSLQLRRQGPANQPEADNWELKASFGYRVPRAARAGS